MFPYLYTNDIANSVFVFLQSIILLSDNWNFVNQRRVLEIYQNPPSCFWLMGIESLESSLSGKLDDWSLGAWELRAERWDLWFWTVDINVSGNYIKNLPYICLNGQNIDVEIGYLTSIQKIVFRLDWRSLVSKLKENKHLRSISFRKLIIVISNF